jgi:hypothetical protein
MNGRCLITSLIEISYYNSEINQFSGASSYKPYGYLNYGFNAGSIANKGIEIVLSGKVIEGDKFRRYCKLFENTNIVKEIPSELGGEVILTQAGVNNYIIFCKKDSLLE